MMHGQKNIKLVSCCQKCLFLAKKAVCPMFYLLQLIPWMMVLGLT